MKWRQKTYIIEVIQKRSPVSKDHVVIVFVFIKDQQNFDILIDKLPIACIQYN